LDAAARKAKALLATLRQTAMRRGAISGRQGRLKADIAIEIEVQGIPTELAQRIALQLVFKFDIAQLAGRDVWRAIGRLLQKEVERLRAQVGLADRQIVAVLPKLSARQIEGFLEELRAADRRIARTILNAALQAAEPLVAGRRYLAEYRGVAQHLQTIEPGVARTLANASFTAGAPRRKAMEYFKQLADLKLKFQDQGELARTPAKSAFRARDPRKAAETFMSDSRAVIAGLASHGVEAPIAKTLASSSRFRGTFRRNASRIVL
jgi:hypothetical protein